MSVAREASVTMMAQTNSSSRKGCHLSIILFLSCSVTRAGSSTPPSVLPRVVPSDTSAPSYLSMDLIL